MSPLPFKLLGGSRRIADDFNRTLSGSLGSTSTGGAPWSILTGTWNVNGTKPTTATSQSSNPLATVNTNRSDINAELAVGAGDALYFRVQDATNWWRLLLEGYQTSTGCSTCCSTCNDAPVYTCVNSNNVAVGCSGCFSCSCSCSYACSMTVASGCNYSCNCYSCGCTYYDNYRVLTQKMVAGTLTTVSTSSILQGSGNALATLRVVTLGSTVTSYRNGVQVYTGSDAALATQTRQGIGRGASNYNNSQIDNFKVEW